jgi:hypothetical protein
MVGAFSKNLWIWVIVISVLDTLREEIKRPATGPKSFGAHIYLPTIIAV